MTKAILFDMDGVLIDSHDAWFDRFNASLKHFGFKEITLKEFDTHVWAVSFLENNKNYFPGIGLDPVLEYYHETFDEFIAKLIKMENAEQILKSLKEKEILVALTSNTESKIAKKILEKINLIEYFDVIVGGEEIENPKPHPEMLIKACKKLKVNPSESKMVGDTIYDQKAAEAAKIDFIGYKMENGITDLMQIMELI